MNNGVVYVNVHRYCICNAYNGEAYVIHSMVLHMLYVKRYTISDRYIGIAYQGIE